MAARKSKTFTRAEIDDLAQWLQERPPHQKDTFTLSETIDALADHIRALRTQKGYDLEAIVTLFVDKTGQKASTLRNYLRTVLAAEPKPHHTTRKGASKHRTSRTKSTKRATPATTTPETKPTTSADPIPEWNRPDQPTPDTSAQAQTKQPTQPAAPKTSGRFSPAPDNETI